MLFRSPAAGHLLQRAIEARGIRVITRANTRAILGAGRVEAVELDNGTRLPADLVIMAVGIRPNMQLAKEAGLAVNRGIVVDATMHTSDPDILAVGECVEVLGQSYGLVAPLYEQAAVLARQLQSHLHAAPDTPRYAGSVLSTRLKVAGIDVFSAGQIQAEEGDEEVILSDPQGGVYRKLVLRDDRLRGAVLFGDSGGAAELLDCLLHATPLGMLREQLLCAA